MTIQHMDNGRLWHITSDGIRFKNERDAYQHELFTIKMRARGSEYDADITLIDCENADELNEYVEVFRTHYDERTFTASQFLFPVTIVLSERPEYHRGECITYLDAYTLDDWKEMRIDQINGIY